MLSSFTATEAADPMLYGPQKGAGRGSRGDRPALKLQGHPPSRLQPLVPFRLGQLCQRFHFTIKRPQIPALLPQLSVERRHQPVVSVHVVQACVVQRPAEPALVVGASAPGGSQGFVVAPELVEDGLLPHAQPRELLTGQGRDLTRGLQAGASRVEQRRQLVMRAGDQPGEVRLAPR